MSILQYNIMEKLSNAIDYFDSLVKTAFLEVPQTVFNEMFEIYKEMYFDYMKHIEKIIKQKTEEKKKFNQIIFKGETEVWRKWIKNLKKEDDHFISYIIKKYPKLIIEFLNSDRKNIVFIEKIPTINEIPIGIEQLEFWMTIKKEYLDESIDNKDKRVKVFINGVSQGTYEYEEINDGLEYLLESLYKNNNYKKYSKITENFLKDIKNIDLSDNELEYYKYAEYAFNKKQLADWKYVDILFPEGNYFLEVKLAIGFNLPHTDKIFNTSHNGYATKNEIYININSKDYIKEIINTPHENINYFSDVILNKIKDTLHHELSHIMQLKIKSIRGFLAGLPKQLKNTHDPHGVDRKTLERTQEHELRDIEIYPRLGDSVRNFNEKTKYMNANKKKQFLKDFIGLNGIKDNTDFNFRELLENKSPRSKEIYKLVVKRFLKMIDM